jgi:hypothetical protein
MASASGRKHGSFSRIRHAVASGCIILRINSRSFVLIQAIKALTVSTGLEFGLLDVMARLIDATSPSESWRSSVSGKGKTVRLGVLKRDLVVDWRSVTEVIKNRCYDVARFVCSLIRPTRSDLDLSSHSVSFTNITILVTYICNWCLCYPIPTQLLPQLSPSKSVFLWHHPCFSTMKDCRS